LRAHRSAIESLIATEAEKQKPVQCPDDTTINTLSERVAQLHNEVYTKQNILTQQQNTHNALMKKQYQSIDIDRKKFIILNKSLNELNKVYDKIRYDVNEAKIKLTAVRHITEEQTKQPSSSISSSSSS